MKNFLLWFFGKRTVSCGWCKFGKHYKIPYDIRRRSYCTHPKAYEMTSCGIMRQCWSLCGLWGKYFEEGEGVYE